ncbi:MAG: hypothetical protein GX297_10115 [Treponema sp.]|jgi:Na+/melibiose symporter-like transporter|nr:hypothetical protein [Treponema sp.]
MKLEELEEKINLLNKKKQGFDRNKNICILVVVIIFYYMYQAYKSGETQWWFLLIMCFIIVITTAIFVFDYFQTNKIKEELKLLENEKKSLTEPEIEENIENTEEIIAENSSDEPSFSAGSWYE